ncbi:acriflavin resistance protein [Allostella sp. ATCC 35155]|nr:acriflavin resistance protein [Stella sp. ATCC 35155]
MKTLIDAAIQRGRVTVALLVLILLFGAMAWRSIPKEAEPDVNIPIIYVSMALEGVSPEDSERLLLRPMEKELRSVEGVKEMRSTAYLGGGYVILEFEAGFDAQKALTDVRESVNRAKSELPQDTDEPLVKEVNVSLFPVLVVTLSGEVPERTLLRLARDLRDRLETIPSVLSVRIAGDREELVEILIDPLRVETYGLSAGDLAQSISRNNQLIAAGQIDTGQGRFAIKVPGLFESVREILDMPVKVEGDAVVRVRDIAEVRRTYKDRQSYARVDGRPAIALEVSKRIGQNIIDTIDEVRKATEEEQERWPANVVVGFTQDKSDDIKMMLADLENNLGIAVLLVMVIVLASLGMRSTILVGVSIVGSFLTAILLLAGMGLTINIVVLFGLIFAAGNVVDGAIVVTEFADRRMAEGMERAAAYRLAATRMAWPIISAIATQIAAFLPLLFWPGVVGEFMKFLPITQLVVLSASVLMALVFIPVLGTWFGRSSPGGAIDEPPPDDAGTRLYVRMLGWSLRRPVMVLLATVVALVGVQWWYATHGNGVEFFPDVEPDLAIVTVSARGNLSTDEKDRLVREVENRILALHRERGEFATIYSATRTRELGKDMAEDVVGVIQLEFADWKTRRKASAILADIMQRTRQLAGIVVETRRQEAGPPIGKPIQVQLAARDPAMLEPAARRVREILEGIEGLKDIEDSRPLPGVEWQILVDRAQAAKFGADVQSVGSSIRLVTNGLKFGEYRPDDSDDEIDIVARYPRDERGIAQLGLVRVQTNAGLVPIENFVTRRPAPSVSEIQRVDGRRTMTVKADVEAGVLADDKLREFRAKAREEPLPPGLSVRFKGQDEEQQKAQEFLSQAFLAAIFLIFVILLAQFNSFYTTFVILTGVVMSTIGVFVGLIVTGQPFGIVMTGIGVVALAGIVVQNNIVLIDTFDQLVKTSPSVMEALLQTGRERLRPVLLTAFNTVLGLLPLMIGVNIDLFEREVTIDAPATQWWIGLSTAICFGLGFSTILTLLVTPCALMIRGNVAAWRERRRAARGESRPAPAQ